jgi:membrane protein implicated in regulation of membrane protease activity
VRDHYISAEGLFATFLWLAVFGLLGAAGVALGSAAVPDAWALWLSAVGCATSAVAAVVQIRCMLSRMCRLIRAATGFDAEDGHGQGLRAVT